MKKISVTGIIILAIFLFVSRADAALTSPRAVCQYYVSNFPVFTAIITDTENNCTLRIGDNNAGFGNIHAYYSGNNFCMETSGEYFGYLSPKTDCVPISPAGKVQQPGQSNKQSPTKIITPPSFQIKELQYDTLPTGKLIQAGDNERIELKLPDGSLIQLDAKATFTPVSDYEVQGVFGRYRYLWQPFHDGKCIVGQNLVRQDCRKVVTRDAILAVRGTEFLVETDNSGTTVTVLEGLLGASDLSGKKTVEVPGGQFTYIKRGGLPDDPKAFDSAKIDRWWNKRTLEQTAMLYTAIITGLILLIVIPVQIKINRSAKKKLASEAASITKENK